MTWLRGHAGMMTAYLAERKRYGLPESIGPLDREVLFLVDGVGGFQVCAAMVRRVIRQAGSPLGTILFDWQTRIRPDIWSDLMRYRRNRFMAVRLARKLMAFHRTHPTTRIHLFAVSAGTGMAVFACERLKKMGMIDTLILACPALSPAYNLAPALRAVRRCYALISRRDFVILGLGTRLFGTMDRIYTASAGHVGFDYPKGMSHDDREVYQRLREVHWWPELKRVGNRGGHAGWVSIRFLERHLLPLVRGEPELPVATVGGTVP